MAWEAVNANRRGGSRKGGRKRMTPARRARLAGILSSRSYGNMRNWANRNAATIVRYKGHPQFKAGFRASAQSTQRALFRKAGRGVGRAPSRTRAEWRSAMGMGF